MRLLIDTHAFLWLVAEPELLSHKAITLLKDECNEIFLSSISIWEIEQKYQIKKLKLPAAPSSFIGEFRDIYDLSPLAFDEASAFQLNKLPLIHNDPFDRMLVCQAIQYSLVMLTNDRSIQKYPIRTIW